MDYFFLETVSLIHYPLHPISLTFCSQALFKNKNSCRRTTQSESHTLPAEVDSLLRLPSKFSSELSSKLEQYIQGQTAQEADNDPALKGAPSP